MLLRGHRACRPRYRAPPPQVRLICAPPDDPQLRQSGSRRRSSLGQGRPGLKALAVLPQVVQRFRAEYLVLEEFFAGALAHARRRAGILGRGDDSAHLLARSLVARAARTLAGERLASGRPFSRRVAAHTAICGRGGVLKAAGRARKISVKGAGKGEGDVTRGTKAGGVHRVLHTLHPTYGPGKAHTTAPPAARGSESSDTRTQSVHAGEGS